MSSLGGTQTYCVVVPCRTECTLPFAPSPARLRAQVLAQRTVDVLGDLEHLLGHDRCDRDLEVSEQLRAEQLCRDDSAAQLRTCRRPVGEPRVVQVLRPDAEPDRPADVRAE